MNRFRTFMLMVGLTVLFVIVGGALGGRQGAFWALLLAAGMNFFTYWFSDKLVLKRYRAAEVGPNDGGRLYSTVAELTQRAGLPMPKVAIAPSQQPNAFATGRDPQHAVVCFTHGILGAMSREELEGVTAHELAHIKNRDMLTNTLAATMAGAVMMLARLAFFFGDRDRNPIVGLAMLILAPLAAFLVQMAISRSREYAADKGGAGLAQDPEGLASALEALHRGIPQREPMTQTGATAHMMIANPFFGMNIGRLFSSHPDPKERIRRLRTM